MSPGVREIWTWMGAAPVTRESFTKLLRKRISCIIVPGGVQECLHMQKGREVITSVHWGFLTPCSWIGRQNYSMCSWSDKYWQVIYLKQRYGFVKVAMETGSPLIPTFCFGQVCSCLFTVISYLLVGPIHWMMLFSQFFSLLDDGEVLSTDCWELSIPCLF